MSTVRNIALKTFDEAVGRCMANGWFLHMDTVDLIRERIGLECSSTPIDEPPHDLYDGIEDSSAIRGNEGFGSSGT